MVFCFCNYEHSDHPGAEGNDWHCLPVADSDKGYCLPVKKIRRLADFFAMRN